MRIEIDRSIPLHEGGAGGHNRWHPDLGPIARLQPDQEVWIELRDSRDGSLTRESNHTSLPETPSVAHPLTGPIWIRAAH